MTETKCLSITRLREYSTVIKDTTYLTDTTAEYALNDT